MIDRKINKGQPIIGQLIASYLNCRPKEAIGSQREIGLVSCSETVVGTGQESHSCRYRVELKQLSVYIAKTKAII